MQLKEDQSAKSQLHQAIDNILLINSALEKYIPVLLHLLSLESTKYPLPAELEGENLRRAVEEALGAIVTLGLEIQPMILLLEGWQWADRASHTTMRSLANLIPNFPILFVLSYRPDVEIQWGNISNHTHMRLKPISLTGTRQIVRSILDANRLPSGFADVVHSRTEGNPLFIEELCRGLLEESSLRVVDGRAILNRPLDKLGLPDTVQTVISARMDRLDWRAREVLRIASVIGLRFSQAVLERIYSSPTDLQALQHELTNLEFIQQVSVFPEVSYRFKHAITQTVAYESLLLYKRKELHEQVAQTTEMLNIDRLAEHFEELAYHYSRSDNIAKAVQYLELAGDKGARFSRIEARKHYSLAVDLLSATATNAEQKRKRIDLATKLASVSFYSPSREIIAVLEQSAKDAQSLGDTHRTAISIFWIGFMQYGLGNHVAALTFLDQCAVTAQTLDDRHLKCQITNYIGRNKFHLADFPGSAEHLHLGIKEFQRLDQPEEAANSIGILSMAHAFQGDFAECFSLLKKISDIAANIDDSSVMALYALFTAHGELVRGNWRKAEAALTGVAQIARKIGNYTLAGLALWAEGYAVSMQGEPKRGIPLMKEGLNLSQSNNGLYLVGACYGRMSEVYADLGDNKQAAFFSRKAIDLGQSGADKLGELNAYRSLSIVEASKNWGKAETLIRKCIDISEARGARPDVALGKFRYAQMLSDRSEPQQARNQLNQATALFRDMEMTWWLEQAEALGKRLEAG